MAAGSIKTHPFPGLRPYTVEDSAYFFGREREKYKAIKQLIETGFLTVVGLPGEGKSSMVNCNIIEELINGYLYRGAEKWQYTAFRPGKNPLAALAQSLSKSELIQKNERGKIASNLSMQFEEKLKADPYAIIDIIEKYELTKDKNLLIFIDQLEDLVSLDSDENDVQVFLEQLIKVTRQKVYPVVLVSTLRLGTGGNFTKYPEFAQLITKCTYLIPQFSEANLSAIFEGISSCRSVSFSSDYLESFYSYYRNNPFNLVEFQHVMKSAHDNWVDDGRKGSINKGHLERSGGIGHSIPSQLEKIFISLNEEQKSICKLLFKSLTGISDTGMMVCRPMTVFEIAAHTRISVQNIEGVARLFTDEKCGVLQVYRSEGIKGRLESFDSILSDQSVHPFGEHSEVVVAQDVVLQRWQRLNDWVKSEKEKSNVFLNLVKDSSKRDLLYQGDKLERMATWFNEEKPTKEWASRYHSNYDSAMLFLQESINAENLKKSRRQKEVATRERKERRFRTFMFVFTLGAIVLILISGFLGERAVEKQLEANSAKREAEKADSLATEKTAMALRANIEARDAEVRARKNSQLAKRSKVVSDSLGLENKKAQLEVDAMLYEISLKKQEITASQFKLSKSKNRIKDFEKKVALKELKSNYLRYLEQIEDIVKSASKMIQENILNGKKVILGANIALDAYQKYEEIESEFNLQVRDFRKEREIERKLMMAIGLAFQHIDNNSVAQVFKDVGISYGVKLSAHPTKTEIVLGTDEGKLYDIIMNEKNPLKGIKSNQIESELSSGVDGIRDLHFSKGGDFIYYSTVEGHIKVVGEDADILPEYSSEQMPSMVLVHRFETGNMISVGYNSTIYFYEVGQPNSKPIKVISSPIAAVDFAGESNTMVLSNTKGVIELMKFDEITKKIIESSQFVVKGLHSPVSKLKFLSNKNIVVIGTREGEVIFYSLNGEGEVLFVDENEHSGRVNCIHYNFENNLIITGGNDKVINVWELAVLADRVLKERQYSPIKFLEKLPVQDIQFVNSSWFMTVTRGTSIGEGEGRVSMWSIKVDELERELNDLVSRNTFKASEIDVKKYTEN